jgi:sulfite reductase (ferredoxin)
MRLNYYLSFESKNAQRWVPGIKALNLTKERWDVLTQDTKNAELVKAFREGDKDAKTKLPAVCWSGYTQEGNTRKIESMTPTGLYMIDIDHIDHLTPEKVFEEIRGKLPADIIEALRLAHITPSGKGLRMVMQCTENFPTLAEHMQWLDKIIGFNQYGDFDTAVKDVSRLSFIPQASDILFESEKLWEDEPNFNPIDSPLTPLLKSGEQSATTNEKKSQATNAYSSPLSKRGGGGESVVVPITLGNIRLDDEEKVEALKALIRFVAQFGDDTLRFTTRQNIRLRNIPAEAQDELSKYIKRYVPENFSKPAVINNIVSCTGADTCRLGICLSKGLTNAIIRALEKSGLDLNLLQDARINVSGCPNLCGQPLWSDLGFVGKVLHTDHVYPAYQVYVGANYTDSPALAESIGTINAYDTPKFVVDLVRKFSEAKPQTFNSWLRSAEGRATAEELIAKYKDIPPFAEDKNYYFDWGSDEVFNVTKRGKPECSAGLFDMIQVDQDAIKEARDKSAYDVIFHASRMLLVTRGLDPQDAAGVFDAFIEHFINTGYVDSAFKALISQAKAEGKQGSYDNAKANALADAVITLYEGMDDSLNFKNNPLTPPNGEELSSSSKRVALPRETGEPGGGVKTIEIERLKDLRGVLCPMNFVKTKLELATMQSGDVLEIWLDDGKPIENVPGSVKLEGHEILSQTQHTDGYWQVIIKKK